MLRRLAGAFDLAAAFLSCALVVALLACVAMGALTRTLGDPLIWTDELSRFLMVWLAVFGWILASRKRLHVRIRYFHDMFCACAYAVEVGSSLPRRSAYSSSGSASGWSARI
jgi:TRAP-type C4-dicarboxylate transport system permease small subunit